MIGTKWPVDIRFDNLLLVTELLRRIEVPFLVHAPRTRTRTAVMVAEEDRASVARALSLEKEWRGAKVIAAGPVPPLVDLASWPAVSELRKAGVFAVVGPSEFAMGHAVDRLRYAVEIEFWTRDALGYLRAPKWGRVQNVIDKINPDTDASLANLGSFHEPGNPGHIRATFPARTEFLISDALDCQLPVDVVYTWVNGRDPDWVSRRGDARGAAESWHAEAAHDSRYLERDELRYSVRSILANAPWVRRIYIATDNQRPHWLPEDTERIRVVDHRDFFSHRAVLPVFNSHAIESQLHRLDGLSNHFLYFNDDVLLGAPVDPSEVINASGQTAVHLSRTKVPVPDYPELRGPVDAAFRNVRRLLERDFGRTVTAVTLHTPHPLRVDVLAEMADRYRTAWDHTEASKFRGPGDLSPTSAFYQYYSWFTGRAFLGQLTYSYTNLAASNMRERLARLISLRSFQAICLNDSDAHPDETPVVDALLRDFFEEYFPIPGPHESDR